MSCFSCSCVPPPASQKPRKIYNVLVPDVFPANPPPADEPVPGSIKRKIGKLQEYVQRNPGKIAKVTGNERSIAASLRHASSLHTLAHTLSQVSRRLTRRIKQALYDHHLGYVKIAVNAYCYLLDQSTDEDSSYSLNYFTKELIDQPDAVVSRDTRGACMHACMHPFNCTGTAAETLHAWAEPQTSCLPPNPRRSTRSSPTRSQRCRRSAQSCSHPSSGRRASGTTRAAP
jgi:hypothetical protein